MFEFQVKSVQDKVENDYTCQNLMLVPPAGEKSRDRFISYPAPLTTWETRRIDLSAGTSGEGPGMVKSIRLGANPKGTKCAFWVRGLRLLKSAR